MNVTNALSRRYISLPSAFLGSLFPEFERLLSLQTGGEGAPFPVDVKDTPESYIVTADLPGFKPEEIQVELHGKQLCIAARRNSESSDERQEGSYLVRERVSSSTSLARVVPLPSASSECSAEYVQGVLTVEVKKASEQRPQKIAIVAK